MVLVLNNEKAVVLPLGAPEICGMFILVLWLFLQSDAVKDSLI